MRQVNIFTKCATKAGMSSRRSRSAGSEIRLNVFPNNRGRCEIAHMNDFHEKSSFSTWLTRIAINSALMILRKKRGWREISFDGVDDSGDTYECWEVRCPAENPESRFARKEKEELLEDAILQLPQVLREVVE